MSRLTNPLATISFVVLFGSAVLTAQTPVTPDRKIGHASVGSLSQSQTYVIPAPLTPECPVSMRAQHGSGGGLMMTRSPKSGPNAQPNQDGRSGLEQRIHLILGKVKDSARVVAAKVTVRGTNGKWLALPASSLQLESSRDGSSNVGSGSAIKTIDVRFGVTPNSSSDQTEFADLVLPGFSSVQSITLNSLTYSDGSTWNSFKGNACRVAPDPFMLVSAR